MYDVGMLCKHFKGKDLMEKNIYQIIALGVSGDSLSGDITYLGEQILQTATNLVIYANIFQEGKFFAREYEDLSQELSDDKKCEFGQTYRVEPLSIEEVAIVTSPSFISEKTLYTESKYQK